MRDNWERGRMRSAEARNRGTKLGTARVTIITGTQM